MPPRAFPLRLKVGIDVCHIPRIRAILTKAKTNGDNGRETRPLGQFLSKVLTLPERQYFWHRFKDEDTAYKSINKVSEFLAGRWAAKEACRKACTHLGISNGLHNIIILPIGTPNNATGDKSGPPKGLILREALQRDYTRASTPEGAPIRKMGVASSSFNINTVDGQFCEISISHDGTLATAVAMVPALPDSWHGRRLLAENKEPDISRDNRDSGDNGDQIRTDLLAILEKESQENARLEALMPKDLAVPDIQKIQDYITILRRRNHQLGAFDKARRLEREVSRHEKRLQKDGIETKK